MGAALVITTMARPTAAPVDALESMFTLSLNQGGQLEVLMLDPQLQPTNSVNAYRFVYRRAGK